MINRLKFINYKSIYRLLILQKLNYGNEANTK
jgi:hypothetical protein